MHLQPFNSPINPLHPPGAGAIISWLWNFGDGATSTLQNPSHTYTATGYYNVSLTVTSSSGCSNTLSIGRYIRVVSGIDVNFNWSQPNTCQPPFVINFQDQSSGPGTLSYLWDLGNGSTSTLQNPSATYPAAGTYTVTLQVQSSLGCTGSSTKNITIAGKTTDFIAPPSVCVGQSVTFQNNSSPAPISSSWDFGDGTTSSQINPVKTYLTSGTFNVKLINNYGNCIDSVTKTINVTSQPAVNFTANDSTACQTPFTVQFTDLSPSAATWLWDFGDGSTSNQQNPSHTFTAQGMYNVTLTITVAGGCTNTLTKQQYIKIGGTTVSIINAPTGGCIPFTYSPIVSIQTYDSIVSYNWDLGEPGATYTIPNPTHTYNSAGNYNLTLTVNTQTGCTFTTTVPNGVRTGTPPTANFTFTPNNVCASTIIQFTDASTTTPSAMVTWYWDFGDGSSSTQQNPSHTYEDTGTLITKLVVSNNGCKDSISKPVTVRPPVAKFGYRVNCNNRLQVTFLNSSLVNPVYGPITYEWHMGDPANTIFYGTPPPVFTYPAYGTYTATLIVTNGPCSYQTTKDIILMNETASFTVSKNPICKSEPVTLTAVVSNPANIIQYDWTIGSQSYPDTTSSLTLTLSAYGSYTVTLTTTDLNGCTNSVTIPNYIVVGGPVADFNPSGPGGCVNSTIGFNDLSTPAGAINQWTWNFGDGTQQTYSSSPFSHTYTQTGSYTVTLFVKDTANCRDTMTKTNVVLITRPVAAFRADTFYCPLAPLQFIDTSTGNGLNYLWSFGDGATSTLQNPTHAYPAGNNTYTVKLKITDLVGCQDSVTKTNYINIRSPQAAFTMQDSAGICIPTVTAFTFQGQDYQSFSWDFGDGTTSTAMNPSHFYNAYGAYTVTLYLTGPGGCMASAQSLVNVYNPYTTTQISANPRSACDSITTSFSITTPPGFPFKFYFGDGTVDSSQTFNLTHTYRYPGNYTPYVLLVDKYGCDAGISGPTINVYGAFPLFSMNKKEFCDNGQVFFLNYTLNNDPIVSTVWNFADGSTSTATEPTHVFNAPGTYIVTLTVTTQNNCTSIAKDTVRIYPTPVLSIGGKDTICINSTERYNGIVQMPDSTIRWKWNFANGNTSQQQNPTVSYNATGNYNIQLIATNKLGCADTASRSIYVVPLPTASPTVDPITIISGGTAPLNMHYTGPIVSYNWQPAQSLSCANCPQPFASPQFSTKYSLKVVDRYGCTAEGFITVKVVCNNKNFFIPNTFSPNGDGVNDVFYLRGTGLFRVKTLRVFSRWGEVVFEKNEVPVNNPAYGWDGTYKGKKAKADVYVYQLEIICGNGETVTYSGNIALIL